MTADVQLLGDASSIDSDNDDGAAPTLEEARRASRRQQVQKAVIPSAVAA